MGGSFPESRLLTKAVTALIPQRAREGAREETAAFRCPARSPDGPGAEPALKLRMALRTCSGDKGSVEGQEEGLEAALEDAWTALLGELLRNCDQVL